VAINAFFSLEISIFRQTQLRPKNMPPKKAKRVNQRLQTPLRHKELPKDDTPVDQSDKENEPQPPAASETALTRAERFKALHSLV
jgi:hypothetical protein